MRIDKFLKNSRLIKRRTLAKEACEQERVWINDRPAKPGSDVKEGDAGEEVYHETGESAPYVGTGYIRVRRKDNKTNYIAYWVHKAIFGIGTESAKTKGQNIEWQTPTLEGSIMGVKNNAALQTRFRERRTFTKESEARAWLNKKAGIEA